MKKDTQCVQAGYRPKNGEPRQVPVIQSTTFKYDTSEDMGKLFDLEASGYFYTRLQNPTNDYVAAKIAELEGGSAAMLTSSGQAANFFALFNICECGSHIVCSSSIYGGTFNLIAVTMAKMGIETTFVSPDATEEELDKAFKENHVEIHGDEETVKLIPDAIVATDEDYGKEYLDYKISVKTVDSVEEAIAHINKYNTGHSEAIITENDEAASKFLAGVDAACVYVNASTRFTDGFEFGFGAEIGISTQKLHARGPMGLKELTSYKYRIIGNGQIRK